MLAIKKTIKRKLLLNGDFCTEINKLSQDRYFFV